MREGRSSHRDRVPPRAPRGPRAVPRARARARSMGEPPADARRRREVLRRVPRHRGRRELRRHRALVARHRGRRPGRQALRPDQDRGGAGEPAEGQRVGRGQQQAPRGGLRRVRRRQDLRRRVRRRRQGSHRRRPTTSEDSAAQPAGRARGVVETGARRRRHRPGRRRGREERGRGGGEEEFAAKEVLVTRDAFGGEPRSSRRGRSLVRSRVVGRRPIDDRSRERHRARGEPVRQPCRARRPPGGGGQKRSETVGDGRAPRGLGPPRATRRLERGRCRGRPGRRWSGTRWRARRGGSRGSSATTAPPSPAGEDRGRGAEDAEGVPPGMGEQTRARKPAGNGQRRSRGRPPRLDRSNRTPPPTTTTRLYPHPAGRAKGLFAPVTRPPTPRTSENFFAGTNDDDDDDARKDPTAVALPAWLTAVARGAVVCEVSHTRASSAEDAARDAAGRVRDRCGFEAPAGLEDSVRPCVVELTRDGVGALRTADECGVLRGDRDLDPVAEAVARVDENLPVAEFGASPLVLVLPTGEEKKAGRPARPLGSRGRRSARRNGWGVVCVSSGPEQLVRTRWRSRGRARGDGAVCPDRGLRRRRAPTSPASGPG